ncbi:SMP-30/gluconolactonase/LRE family protein [Xenorhabdus bovienii]|uniref:SMP-30/gluconolactonase/LRE family protein n=1 Tax=Xenorhabdus bovienii TaxID=40576 RepID=UPI00237D079F|nr:SMP-30/gluconolactonase/LRE family protein [Xenorhabdus bovienii]MDE1481568.1 SMP-30/gluconolactonase/LRE family protein [Xenorhabdus bovienii]MDE9427009.1 SMP-30/gluconolactonase/LRE family protein [Xenorhabdus bovienii]MDE9434855.1 SMP-30/gluconolactonase/LRE family protein [Xenorhabdus bovienii]MDE9440885.1 SMP-30/gluconolactonase/LRE family protein [Xenorhabdus bovienii]MDE9464760.1 SMP-30/gluconolactonase/LRE family protein [Xenorhabdus bovienii]
MKINLEKLCSPAIWAEGPVWLPSENAIIFSDVKGNQMFRWSEGDNVSLWRQNSNYVNGNALDNEERVVSCEHGRRGISRTEKDGSVIMLVDKIDGKRFNSPNDVVVRSDGTIWFTDPPYGIISDEEGYKSESQIIGCYVYCYDPNDNKISIATSDVQRPNGLAFSPDEKWLYVADMSIADFPLHGRHELRIYPVQGKTLGAGKHFVTVSPGFPDGFCVDKFGNIYCSCLDGILIFNKFGKKIHKIAVPERTSNCTFGGINGDQLYITATTSLYRASFRW